MAEAPLLDCLIIGGGAAGLTAAIYLARYRRRLMLLDGDASRLHKIPTSHNYPGFVAGVHGEDLLGRLRAQALEYGAPMATGIVDRLQRNDDGSFTAWCGRQAWHARYVILATGVQDVEPGFGEVAEAVAGGQLRYCPICDGFEAIGKRVAVIGRGDAAVGEAEFIRHFAHELTLFSVADTPPLSEQSCARLRAADIGWCPEPVERLVHEDHAVLVQARGQPARRFDVIYAALGTLVNGGLAQLLGARASDEGELHVDDHQQTTVDGLYAAGDVVLGLNQIAVAMGHAAIAATAVHNRLRRQDDRLQ
ncbi:NAD(P)/FAD-dependent oxidoreductase [Noviherbaspirillum aridicola]|uniref:Pyridine nucleotide-disulfide oxidoreductase n=1 Tax=Noviherbaspirillum aridicola TaxID=2849687 RepID=A0ABQ4Q3G8_9BURK|nr:NAD(P)/FAD-dependent oxidoreductase [Noviherbaspirillum aridicola]GIZ51720.1 pyridine nucleotide-disulfide oxidoreductase [Noviherbaspirillum aridicola]